MLVINYLLFNQFVCTFGKCLELLHVLQDHICVYRCCRLNVDCNKNHIFLCVCVKKHCLCNLLILIVMLHALGGLFLIICKMMSATFCFVTRAREKILQNGSICKLIQKFVFQRRHENIDGWSGCSWKNNHSVQAQTGRDCDNYSHNRLVQNVQVS